MKGRHPHLNESIFVDYISALKLKEGMSIFLMIQENDLKMLCIYPI